MARSSMHYMDVYRARKLLLEIEYLDVSVCNILANIIHCKYVFAIIRYQCNLLEFTHGLYNVQKLNASHYKRRRIM